MTRREYTESVLSALRHVTRREREAIRAEIDGHIEDHMADLLELDYPPELVEERTLSAMGDPAEVGRALNRQYPLGWLVVSRTALAAVLVLLLLLTQVNWQAVRWNLDTRFRSSDQFSYEEPYEFLNGSSLDIRVDIGPVVSRVCAAKVLEIQPDSDWAEIFPEEQYLAVVAIRSYNRSLWDIGRFVQNYSVGPGLYVHSETGMGAGGLYSTCCVVPVERGETEVTASYTEHGYDVSVQIPLDWGDIV